ncbi:MAG: apolipoprotein N-acyltransferase, partial [Limisphaerales bacterium]
FIPVTGFPILGWLALSAYCALYPGLWVWLCWRLAPTGARTPLPTGSLSAAETMSFMQRTTWAFKCAVLWVALETILGCFLTGFPWLALGVSQHKMTPLIQIASVTGVSGVSFLAVWFAVALAGDATGQLFRRVGLRKGRPACLLPLFVAAIAVAWGLSRLVFPSARTTSPGQRSLTLALVQPSIPQAMIWNPAEKTNRFAKLMQLSELALATKPDVLVWPEAALPDMSEENFRAVTNLVVQHKVLMVFGADDFELKAGAPPGSNRPSDYAFYNSAFLLSPEGRVVSTYRKRRLVIFGEYIPLLDWLPFLKWFTPIEGGFTAGREPVAFPVSPRNASLPAPERESVIRSEPDKSNGLRAGMLICFEDVLAPAARESAEDADFLLNLTNDGWFGESAQQFQHASHSVFRAVENGLPVVRCTNNGLTCWVDELGFLHDLGPGSAADVYGPGFRVVKPLVSARASREPTFYQRHGNWFGWSCVFGALGVVALPSVRRRG